MMLGTGSMGTVRIFAIMSSGIAADGIAFGLMRHSEEYVTPASFARANHPAVDDGKSVAGGSGRGVRPGAGTDRHSRLTVGEYSGIAACRHRGRTGADGLASGKRQPGVSARNPQAPVQNEGAAGATRSNALGRQCRRQEVSAAHPAGFSAILPIGRDLSRRFTFLAQ